MVWAFDIDGTICDMWYSADFMDLYRTDDPYDWATRSMSKDCYKDARLLPVTLDFINVHNEYYDRLAFITNIANGHEYMQKRRFIERNADEFVKPAEPDDVYGTVSNEDKLHVLRELAFMYEQPVLYFDDRIKTVCYINESEEDPRAGYPVCSVYPVYAVHISSIQTRTAGEIVDSMLHICGHI